MHGCKPLAATLWIHVLCAFFMASFFFEMSRFSFLQEALRLMLFLSLFCFASLNSNPPPNILDFPSSLWSPSSFSSCAHITMAACCGIHVSVWPTGPCIAFRLRSRKTSHLFPSPSVVPRSSASSLFWDPACCSCCLKLSGQKPAVWDLPGAVAGTLMSPGGVFYRERRNGSIWDKFARKKTEDE